MLGKSCNATFTSRTARMTVPIHAAPGALESPGSLPFLFSCLLCLSFSLAYYLIPVGGQCSGLLPKHSLKHADHLANVANKVATRGPSEDRRRVGNRWPTESVTADSEERRERTSQSK